MLATTMRFERKASVPLVLVALAAGPVFVASPAWGQGKGAAPGPSKPVSAEAEAEAQKHFQRARALYRAGSYREALSELEAAHALDPDAKDLVQNLSMVHERAGQIDEALAWMKTYATMDLDADEKEKAEATIRRLEGAKQELAAQAPSATEAREPPPSPAEPAPTPRGRIDAATISAAAIGVVGLGAGAFFGIRALDRRPDPGGGFVTGRDGTYADLVQRTDDAHRDAVIADVGFAVGIVGLATAAVLYFARPKHPPPAIVTPHGGGAQLRAVF